MKNIQPWYLNDVISHDVVLNNGNRYVLELCCRCYDKTSIESIPSLQTGRVILPGTCGAFGCNHRAIYYVYLDLVSPIDYIKQLKE